MAERINNLTKPGFPRLQFDGMNTLRFFLVLLTTQIINTKEVSSLDQNQTASRSTITRPAKDLRHEIDFRNIELFKDDDELPSYPQDLKRTSNETKPLTDSTKIDQSSDGPTATTKENQNPRRIFEDYDTSDLQLDKYKLMVAPNKIKTINATSVRFKNPNPSSANNLGDPGIGIKALEILVSGKYLKPPHGAHDSVNRAANYPAFVPESIANTNPIDPVTPVPWVISPGCHQQNASKYIFSAIFSKKPTVHLLRADNGTAPNNPKIFINETSVAMSVGNATQKSDRYEKTRISMNSSNTTPKPFLTKTANSVVILLTTNNNTTPDKNPGVEQPIIEDTVLKKLTETIQNITKSPNHVAVSKVGNAIAISGGINTNGTDQKPLVLSQQTPTAQQIQQQTAQLISQIQANVPAKTPFVTITAQETKKIEPIPLFILDNSLLRPSTPGITFNGTATTAFKKSQQAINNILNSELEERSFFPPEANRNFKRPTEKKTVRDLITQTKSEDIQSSDILYELFKNITGANVINEDLNRKLLNESQIHTQQNWQLIKGNTDILNALKYKNQQNAPPQISP